MEEIVANVVWMTLITDGPRHFVILPLTAPPPGSQKGLRTTPSRFLFHPARRVGFVNA